MATLKDFKGDQSTWCPGCGHFSVMAGIQKAAINLGLTPDDIAVISGIGCSGKVSEYMKGYNFHTLHGRSVPVAQGVKMGNPNMKVIAAGGDGDGYGIGLGHFVHAARRNIDMTYVVMDNQIYGLTKGQTSPRSSHGFVTKTTKKGNKEFPIDPLATALSNGVTFLGQAFSGDIKGMTDIIEQAMKHKGFSLVNVFSPCVTFNKVNTYDYFKEHLHAIDEPITDRNEALSLVKKINGMITGVIFKEEREDFQSMLEIEWDMFVDNGNMDTELLRKTEKLFK